MSTFQWWGYQHVNGSLHIKRFFSVLDIADARESPFCRAVYGPFDAESHIEAREILVARLEGKKPS